MIYTFSFLLHFPYPSPLVSVIACVGMCIVVVIFMCSSHLSTGNKITNIIIINIPGEILISCTCQDLSRCASSSNKTIIKRREIHLRKSSGIELILLWRMTLSPLFPVASLSYDQCLLSLVIKVLFA